MLEMGISGKQILLIGETQIKTGFLINDSIRLSPEKKEKKNFKSSIMIACGICFYMIKDKNKINNLEKSNIQIKKEKMEMRKNINILENDINSVSIENKSENLKIQKDINLKEKIKEIENKNKEIIKQLNEQINLRNEEIIKVNKNYNVLYNQYKLILRNNHSSEII